MQWVTNQQGKKRQCAREFVIATTVETITMAITTGRGHLPRWGKFFEGGAAMHIKLRMPPGPLPNKV